MGGQLISKVYDNFFEDYDAFRTYVDRLDYTGIVSPDDGVTYPGISTAIPDYFATQVKLKVGDPKRLFLRLSPQGQEVPHQAHTDEIMGKYTMIVYLNREEDCEGGTSIVEHIETGLNQGPCTQEQVDVWRADTNKPEKWRRITQVDMKPNRAFVLDSKWFHRSEPLGGFGTDNTNARLVMVGFFDEIEIR